MVEYAYRDVPKEFGDSLPSELYWQKQDVGAWGTWPANGPVAELFNHGSYWISHCRDKHTVIQAGGNQGLYALWYSRHFKHVHTFEPDPDNYHALVTNIASADNITSYMEGVSDKRGTANLNYTDGRNVGAHKIDNQTTGTLIQVCAIDDYEIEDVSIIHLDIEGHEIQAIAGAHKTIEKYRPVIISEKNIAQEMRKYNYKMMPRAHDHVYVPITDGDE